MTDQKLVIASPNDKLETVERAIRDYHFALDLRQHGMSAANQALETIQTALDMPWVQGAEFSRRQKPKGAK